MYMKKLVKETPNDQELGEKTRKRINDNKICCDKLENKGFYTDARGVVFPQCKECGKILT